MAENEFTLTNIMRGMWELKLHSVLDEEFKLFWGLIMTSNALRFKNPIEVVNAQAMVLAKVNSREMLRRRRNALTKKRIYGQWILRYKSGNRMFNESGKYEINLDFIASAAGVWNGDTADFGEGLSTGIDRSVDSSVDNPVDNIRTEPLTTPLTTLRSEDTKLSNIPDSEKENGKRRLWVLKELSDMYGYHVIVKSGIDTNRINSIGAFADDEVKYALDTTLKNVELEKVDLKTASDAMAYILAILKNRSERAKIAAKKRQNYHAAVNNDFILQEKGRAEDKAAFEKYVAECGGPEAYEAERSKMMKEAKKMLFGDDNE